MRKSTKALLYSAFVFPGAGQWLLERKPLALSLFVTAGCATLTIAYYIFSSALAIVDRVTSGEVPPDILVIRRLVQEQQAAADPILLNPALVILVFSWLVGIIDVWRTSRSQTQD